MDTMKNIVLIFVCTVLSLTYSARLRPRHDTCHTSGDCPASSCCRDREGTLITLSGTFDTIGPILENQNGTCVPLLAQYGEHCGEFCPCDELRGLQCYRHVSDQGFEPSICREKTFVDKQVAFWLECFKDPHCQLTV